jgi:hypothetical protein
MEGIATDATGIATGISSLQSGLETPDVALNLRKQGDSVVGAACAACADAYFYSSAMMACVVLAIAAGPYHCSMYSKQNASCPVRAGSVCCCAALQGAALEHCYIVACISCLALHMLGTYRSGLVVHALAPAWTMSVAHLPGIEHPGSASFSTHRF